MIWIRTLLIIGWIALMAPQSVKALINEKHPCHEIYNNNSHSASFDSEKKLNGSAFIRPHSGFNFTSSHLKISTSKWTASLSKYNIREISATIYAAAISQNIDHRLNVAVILFPFHDFW